MPSAIRMMLLVLTLGGLAGCASAGGEKLLDTSDGPVQLEIVRHASFALQWHGRTIIVDPTGAGSSYPEHADLVLITHPHSDHMSPETLSALDLGRATLVMPQSVADQLGSRFGAAQRVLANGETADIDGIHIEAVPMYNLPVAPDAFHPRGWGNGYVLTLADKRVYISGDTSNTPEVQALQHIDVAFICTNLPWTMDVEDAAAAVLAFKPKAVYPYHYLNADGSKQDLVRFREIVQATDPAIDVRLRDWYAKPAEAQAAD